MVNDLDSIDDLELMPLGGGYMVRRERLMNELIAKGRKGWHRGSLCARRVWEDLGAAAVHP